MLLAHTHCLSLAFAASLLVRQASLEQHSAARPGGSEAPPARDTPGSNQPRGLTATVPESRFRGRREARGSHLKFLRQARDPGRVRAAADHAQRAFQDSPRGLLTVTLLYIIITPNAPLPLFILSVPPPPRHHHHHHRCPRPGRLSAEHDLDPEDVEGLVCLHERGQQAEEHEEVSV